MPDGGGCGGGVGGSLTIMLSVVRTWQSKGSYFQIILEFSLKIFFFCLESGLKHVKG